MSQNKTSDEKIYLILLFVLAFIIYIPLNAYLSRTSKSIGLDALLGNGLDSVKLQVIKSYVVSVGIIPLIFTIVAKCMGIKNLKSVFFLFFAVFFLLTSFFILIA